MLRISRLCISENLTLTAPKPSLSEPRSLNFTPKVFKLKSLGERSTEQLQNRKKSLQRIYENKNNLEKVNFVLSNAGRTALMPFYGRHKYFMFTATAESLHLKFSLTGYSKAKRSLRDYMYYNNEFPDKSAEEIVSILQSFKLDVSKHEQSLRNIDPRVPTYLLGPNKSCSTRYLSQTKVNHWDNNWYDADIVAVGLYSRNTTDGEQRKFMTYILANHKNGVYDYGLFVNVNSRNIDKCVNQIYDKLPKSTGHIFPILHDGIHSIVDLENKQLSDFTDIDALAENLIPVQYRKPDYIEKNNYLNKCPSCRMSYQFRPYYRSKYKLSRHISKAPRNIF